ncbi:MULTISPECIES: LysR family transcriptional regulator [Vibrio harveyi group]|uniref:LysR family transcriptional regulator n=1 Tax=Vibrio harveyi group TaxID=717610 RepID=UPI002894CFAB|nr:LysR family transcriptional regulator [Vibrio rotiferianus]CAH1588405.1 LysR family transcriptional regulator [Vibrio rotiferianus]
MRHLKSFHVFHVAASSASFSEAANKLNITHGAVSKQIKVLETYLAQPLFYKQGRNMLLTKEGEMLKSYTEQAFQALETGVNKLVQEKHQYLEVSCEPTLTMRWLMPRLSAFNDGCDADVRLSTAGGPVTLGSTGLAMAIRRDDFEPVYHYPKTKLVEEWVGPVFSPDYWQQVKSDLDSVKLLHSQTRPEAWQEWIQRSGGASISGKAEQSFAHFYFCIQAAVDGLGAAMGSYPLVMDDLERGNLVAPFGFVPSGHDYVLLTQDKARSELEQKFVLWLQTQMAECVPCA